MSPIGRVALSAGTEIALFRFLAATELGEMRRLLDENPALLDDLALDKMRRVIDDQTNPRARRQVAERLAIAKRCRTLGVDRVFRSLPAAAEHRDDRSTEE